MAGRFGCSCHACIFGNQRSGCGVFSSRSAITPVSGKSVAITTMRTPGRKSGMAECGRRLVLGIMAGGLVMTSDRVRAAEKLAWNYGFPGIEGGSVDLGAFRGRVMLVTNTASFCGYTYQYEALQTLHETRG